MLARQRYFADRPWESVVLLNRTLCLGLQTQCGLNSESHAAVELEWRCQQLAELSLGEALDFLTGCQARAPFLFLNEDTFAEIGRRLTDTLFVTLSSARRREAVLAVSQYVEGRLARADLETRLNALWQVAAFKVGDRVKTLRGTSHGVVLRILGDGRVAWQPDGGTLEFKAPAETLAPDLEP